MCVNDPSITNLCWISNLSHSPGFWGCFSSEIRFSKNILLELHIKITLLKWLNHISLRNVQVVLSFNSHLSSLLEVFKIKAKEWLGQVLVDLVLDDNIIFRRILTCDQWHWPSYSQTWWWETLLEERKPRTRLPSGSWRWCHCGGGGRKDL